MHPGHRLCEQVGFVEDRQWLLDVLRLVAISLGRHDELACEPRRHLVLLAARARALVSPAVRATYAGFLQHLLTRAVLLPVPRSSRGPFNREAIGTCAARMAEVHRGLTAEGPVSARGVAMVSRLLEDGTGPLYDRRVRPAQLDATLRHVIAALQPGLFGQSLVESAA